MKCRLVCVVHCEAMLMVLTLVVYCSMLVIGTFFEVCLLDVFLCVVILYRAAAAAVVVLLLKHVWGVSVC